MSHSNPRLVFTGEPNEEGRRAFTLTATCPDGHRRGQTFFAVPASYVAVVRAAGGEVVDPVRSS